MTYIELPHPLEAYFAHAEIASSRQGRRFTLSFPYFQGDTVDRLQWWWQVSAAHERIVGEAGVAVLRQQAIDRFRLHIDRWLQNSGNRLTDGRPFPRLVPVVAQALPVADGVENVVTLDLARVWLAERSGNG